MSKLKDLFYNAKYKVQRMKKGYADEDLFSMNGWFIEIFPKMLDEFAERTIGYPTTESSLKEDVSKMPKMWLEGQKEKINEIYRKHNTEDEYNLNDPMCCWLLIIIRIAHCFRMCDEWHKDYEEYWNKKEYDNLNNMIEKAKAEAFYLFEKYFFDLWW